MGAPLEKEEAQDSLRKLLQRYRASIDYYKHVGELDEGEGLAGNLNKRNTGTHPISVNRRISHAANSLENTPTFSAKRANAPRTGRRGGRGGESIHFA